MCSLVRVAAASSDRPDDVSREASAGVDAGSAKAVVSRRFAFRDGDDVTTDAPVNKSERGEGPADPESQSEDEIREGERGRVVETIGREGGMGKLISNMHVARALSVILAHEAPDPGDYKCYVVLDDVRRTSSPSAKDGPG